VALPIPNIGFKIYGRPPYLWGKVWQAVGAGKHTLCLADRIGIGLPNTHDHRNKKSLIGKIPEVPIELCDMTFRNDKDNDPAINSATDIYGRFRRTPQNFHNIHSSALY